MGSMSGASESATRTIFEWGRIGEPSDLLLPLLVAMAIVALVVYFYRRDSVELPAWLTVCLAGLRLSALTVLLFIYLQPQLRTERDVVRHSRAVVLVDTSLSMGLEDGNTSAGAPELSRAQQVAAALAESRFVDQLRRVHDVVLMRFDEELVRVAFHEKQTTPDRANRADRTRQAVAPSAALEQALAPRGTETRIAQAVRQAIFDERASPLSGVILFSDGGQNAGVGLAEAIRAAREARVPLFTVGVGSQRLAANVRVAELQAPLRAFPGDRFTVTGLIQAHGLAGQVAELELVSRQTASDAVTAATEGTVEATQQVTLGADGEMVPVRFELAPGETGRRTILLRAATIATETDTSDNVQESEVEIIDRKTRVLLLSGGPTREYHFLRTLLFRDAEVDVDVLLQTAQPGVSQDADRVLAEFPRRRAELYEYDLILAVDPQWEALDGDQVDLLEQWVAEQAGGLVAIAGPIHTDHWSQDAAMDKIRALYPVEFRRHFPDLDDGQSASAEPAPVAFTREGLDAEFLWLADARLESQQAWASFPGVYQYHAVSGAKPGAVVYAHFSSPRPGESPEQAVYMAGQFYGSGRVFYLGSGELWRLRSMGEAYFEQCYTKLMRHVAQGRLLRGSSRGALLVEKDRYVLGNAVAVNAQLTGSELEPLEAPSVPLRVLTPSGESLEVALAPDATRAGMFRGQFTPRLEGTYRLELSIVGDQSPLSRRIQVRVPDLERQHAQRNETLLRELATATGGDYFAELPRAVGLEGDASIAGRLRDRTMTTTHSLADAPITLWDNAWIMLGFCGLLCAEWLLRRLARLA